MYFSPEEYFFLYNHVSYPLRFCSYKHFTLGRYFACKVFFITFVSIQRGEIFPLQVMFPFSVFYSLSGSDFPFSEYNFLYRFFLLLQHLRYYLFCCWYFSASSLLWFWHYWNDFENKVLFFWRISIWKYVESHGVLFQFSRYTSNLCKTSIEFLGAIVTNSNILRIILE